jgi:hypothetical protein
MLKGWNTLLTNALIKSSVDESTLLLFQTRSEEVISRLSCPFSALHFLLSLFCYESRVVLKRLFSRFGTSEAT